MIRLLSVLALLCAACQTSPEHETAAVKVIGWQREPHVSTASTAPLLHRSVRPSRSRTALERWAGSAAARAVVQCESGNDSSARSHTGKYRGRWQIGPNEWRDWGGLRFASSPELATDAEQNAVAYRGWLARGWQPWTCARIVGVYP